MTGMSGARGRRTGRSDAAEPATTATARESRDSNCARPTREAPRPPEFEVDLLALVEVDDVGDVPLLPPKGHVVTDLDLRRQHTVLLRRRSSEGTRYRDRRSRRRHEKAPFDLDGCGE
jgi:hypothetical protein